MSSNTSPAPEVTGYAAEYFDPNSLDEMRVVMETVLYSSEPNGMLRSLEHSRVGAFHGSNVKNPSNAYIKCC